MVKDYYQKRDKDDEPDKGEPGSHLEFQQPMRHPQEMGFFPLREPEKLALSRYVLFEDGFEAANEMDRLLHYVNFYHLRSLDLFGLKTRGSESSYQTRLWDRGQNLWSVLRNLHDKRALDSRYETILDLMKKSFPSFRGLAFDQTGPSSGYASFIDILRERHPLPRVYPTVT